MKKIHKHDALLGVFFVMVIVGIFAYLFSHLLTNSRAAGLPQQLQEKITRCYENHKAKECPSGDEVKNSTDKKFKGCRICYMKCVFCGIGNKSNDNQCAVDCGAATDEEVFGDPTPLPTVKP